MDSPTRTDSAEPYFFSFIIPAYNEEKYIERTLNAIERISYPKDRYEVLVVENGSTDRTLELAKKYEGEDRNVRAFHSPDKGVSRAKNLGMSKISEKSDWIIFFDADTVVLPDFLDHLNAFFRKDQKKNYTVGTTKVLPLENKSWYAKAWMRFYDVGHRFTHTSYSIQLMRSDLRDKVRFNPELALAEDLALIKDALKYGKFCFVNTHTILTSTRRFEQIGWVTLFFKWNFDALIWRITGAHEDYPAIR